MQRKPVHELCEQLRSKVRPPRDRVLIRVSCDFPECVMPPMIRGKTGGSSRYCYAHAKQLDRGQTLRPYKPRTDIEKRWEAWARSKLVAPLPYLGIKHKTCGAILRVLQTNQNGRVGYRYCHCPNCDKRVILDPRHHQRDVVPGVKYRFSRSAVR